MVLWELFRVFFIVGCLSFGGGYAMIPVIGHQAVAHGWMSDQEFTDIIAVSGMSPGPAATNSAIFVGYKVSGLPGAVAATIGMTLPSLILVMAAAAFLYKVHRMRWVKSAFYGLRPVITGLVLYGAIRFGMNSGMLSGGVTSYMVVSLVIFAGALLALHRYRMHPLGVIILSGLVGAAFYG